MLCTCFGFGCFDTCTISLDHTWVSIGKIVKVELVIYVIGKISIIYLTARVQKDRCRAIKTKWKLLGGSPLQSRRDISGRNVHKHFVENQAILK